MSNYCNKWVLFRIATLLCVVFEPPLNKGLDPPLKGHNRKTDAWQMTLARNIIAAAETESAQDTS